jgi:hypothetical protein
MAISSALPPRTEHPAQGSPGCWYPDASGPPGAIRPPTSAPVLAATQATALAIRPAGSAVSTTITHLYRAERVGWLVMISSGAKPSFGGADTTGIWTGFLPPYGCLLQC